MGIDYTSHLRRDGDLMAGVVEKDLDAHVPTCPEWNVAKLVIHLGIHHRWVADAVRRGGEPPENPSKPGLRGDELVAWFRDGYTDLADLLDSRDDSAPAWSWSRDNRVGFWRRRTTLETMVHRWDAENALAEGTRFDAELATDGIDEILFVFLPEDDETYSGPLGVIELGTSDTEVGWVLTLKPDGPIAERTSAGANADARITAPANDLLLFCWGRRGPDSVEASGDPQLLDVVFSLFG